MNLTDDGDVTEQALLQAYDGGQILRTHMLRPTWHFVAPADLRWMLALSAPRVHGANGHRYRQLGIDGRTHRTRRPAPRAPVHLLPNFDEFTVAYRDRTALLPAGTPCTSAAQMALLSQPVMVGGRSVGTWRRTIAPGLVEVSVALNTPVARGTRQAVERAASAYARHVERSLVLQMT